MSFTNSYEDERRADAYAKLEFPGTYYLAYRDLPRTIITHARGRRAIDFGCGTGRSTRFLRGLGFDATGVDISQDMIRKAREMDPQGDYRLIEYGVLSGFAAASFDLVLSVFTFDNIPTLEEKVRALCALRSLLSGQGRIVNLVSSPEIYVHEWASFSTKDFLENRCARSGDRVRIVITDIDDERPVEDVLWSDSDYRKTYAASGLELVDIHRPLASDGDPIEWVNETRIAPWVIYVLRAAE